MSEETGFKWFEAEYDTSWQAICTGLLECQMWVYGETGKVLRLVRINPRSAASLQAGVGSLMLVKARGDQLGAPWPENAHLAVPSTIAPIAIVVDRNVAERSALLMGGGHTQSMRLSA